jgi:hypothetical protein
MVISRESLSCIDTSARRRLDDPNDFGPKLE